MACTPSPSRRLTTIMEVVVEGKINTYILVAAARKTSAKWAEVVGEGCLLPREARKFSHNIKSEMNMILFKESFKQNC